MTLEHVSGHEYRFTAMTVRECAARPLRVLVCGSRTWVDFSLLSLQVGRFPRDSVIVHGGAPGADAQADRVARLNGYGVDRFSADWKTHGKRAGILRNLAMLDTSPDLVLAFQRDGSRGTQHTIDEARKRGIPVEVFTA